MLHRDEDLEECIALKVNPEGLSKKHVSHVLTVKFCKNCCWYFTSYFYLFSRIKGGPQETTFYSTPMEAVLVCAGHFVSRQRVHVLPLPLSVRLRLIGGLQASTSYRTRPYGDSVVFLGLYAGL